MLSSTQKITSLTAILLGSALAPFALAGGPDYIPDLVPANPTAGECYARVEVPATFSQGSQQVMVEEGYSRLEVQQPQLASRQESVITKEASVKYRVRQPSFRSITEQMLVRPAYDKLTVTPPQFSTVKERVHTSAPRLIWKQGNPGKLAAQGYKIHTTADAGYQGRGYSSEVQFTSSGGKNCGDNCEIWCLVEEPGEAVEYDRKVMTSPGQVRRIPVSAKYKTIHKQVVSDPGGVEEIPVPAEYRNVTVEDVVHPGGETTVNVPPKFADVATKTLQTPARYEWRRVLCAPGTGTIKSSAEFSSTAHSSSASSYSASSATTGSYSVPSSSYGTSSTYSQPSSSYGSTSYSQPSSSYGSGSTYSQPSASPTGRVVTGSGYYGGYDDTNPAFSGSSSKSGNTSPYSEQAKRRLKRRRK